VGEAFSCDVRAEGADDELGGGHVGAGCGEVACEGGLDDFPSGHVALYMCVVWSCWGVEVVVAF
jgi:hypothetical protein